MDPNSNPQPNRIIDWLNDDYEVEVIDAYQRNTVSIKL
jgi:hypothetical protein